MVRGILKNSPLFFAIVEHSSHGIVVTDPEGRIIYVNKALEEISGHDRDRLIGETPRIFSSGYQPKAFYSTLWKTILSGKEWEGELTNRRSDGSVYREHMRIFPVFGCDAEPQSFVAIKRDITRAALIERQEKHLQEILALSEVASQIGHDLRNIWGAMRFGLARLGRCEELPEGARKPFQAIEEALRMGEALTEALTSFAPSKPLPAGRVDLCAWLDRIRPVAEGVLGETITLGIRCEESLTVEVNEDLLERAILNLLANSRDAIEGAGEVWIHVDRFRLEQEDLSRNPWAREGTYARIRVIDNGTGMSDEVRARAIEPFFTTKGPGKGSGLGLPMVYRFVKSHGGFMTLEGSEKEGTVIELLLPLVPDDSGENVAATGATSPMDVLVVEDYTVLADMMADQLTLSGYNPIVAMSATDATRQVLRNPAIGVAIIDMGLPDLPGEQLALRLLSLKPTLRIVLTSGSTSILRKAATLFPGNLEILRKPFDVDQLIEKVERVLHATAEEQNRHLLA